MYADECNNSQSRVSYTRLQDEIDANRNLPKLGNISILGSIWGSGLA